MKAIRLLLVLIFILSTGIGAAMADSRGLSSYAFIPLTSSDSDAGPVREQARQGFSRLARHLLAAQRRGDVIAFEPEFSAGFMKVQYRSGFDISSLVGAPVYSDIHTALAAAPLREQDKNAIEPRAGTPIFSIELYGSCFSGSSLGANMRIRASLRDKTNRVVVNYDGKADGSGNLNGCFGWSGPYSDILPGYKVKFERYDGSWSYTATVPRINFTSVNKSTAVVNGTGPINKPFTAMWEHPKLDNINSYLSVTRNGTVTSSGTWKVDFGNIAMRGDDFVTIKVKRTPNIYVYRDFWLPSVYCGLGDNWCDVYGFPLKSAQVSITHGTKTYNFSGKFNNWGVFYVDLVDSNMEPIFLKAGDYISGASVINYSMPNLTAIPEPWTDRVIGKAPKYKNFWVWLEIASTGTWYSRWVHSNSLGNYWANFSASVDFKSVTPVTVEVFYKDKATGYVTVYLYSTGP